MERVKYISGYGLQRIVMYRTVNWVGKVNTKYRALSNKLGILLSSGFHSPVPTFMFSSVAALNIRCQVSQPLDLDLHQWPA